MMRSKLGRWGLLPDAAQWVKTYDIRGEGYTGVLGPRGPNDVQLIHLRSPAVGDTLGVSLGGPRNFSKRTQLAPDRMLSTLGKWDFLPVAEYPVMNYEIGGERYTAMLGPGGPNDVQLIHHPRPALLGEATRAVGRASPGIDVGPAPGFDAPAPFEWREDAPSALAPNRTQPKAYLEAAFFSSIGRYLAKQGARRRCIYHVVVAFGSDGTFSRADPRTIGIQDANALQDHGLADDQT